jgi:hypothetical protein
MGTSIRYCMQNGGARRDRTADLLHAMQALSQLSYSPTEWRTLRRLAGIVKKLSFDFKNKGLRSSAVLKNPALALTGSRASLDQPDRMFEPHYSSVLPNEPQRDVDRR